MIREATNEDAPAVIQLIDSVYREYGDEIFLEGADKDLLDIEGNYKGRGGNFIVLELEGSVKGTHAVHPNQNDSHGVIFRRLFLDRELRGADWGKKMMSWAIDWTKEQGFAKIEFWSDTRFHRAHRFFEKFHFVKGKTRDMDDGAMPYSEYHFQRDLERESAI